MLVSEVDIAEHIGIRLRAKAYVVELRYERAFASDVAERVLEAFQAEGIRAPAEEEAEVERAC